MTLRYLLAALLELAAIALMRTADVLVREAEIKRLAPDPFTAWAETEGERLLNDL